MVPRIHQNQKINIHLALGELIDHNYSFRNVNPIWCISKLNYLLCIPKSRDLSVSPRLLAHPCFLIQ